MEFLGFPKIARLFRDVIVTEKIDGTNGQILIYPTPDLYIPETGTFVSDGMIMKVGSRSRFLTRDKDNHGFCSWAFDHGMELIAGLGPGRHFGEWWGQGIQRGYGLKEKRFSLFNVARWAFERPECCGCVPILHQGEFDTEWIECVLQRLEYYGSSAAPGYMNPEGIIIYHIAGNVAFKKTLGDDGHKGGIDGKVS